MFNKSELLDKVAYSFFVSEEEKAKILREISNKVQEYKYSKRITRIKHIMKNGDYTTVLWADGTKTIVKRAKGEKDDPETALAYALLKKLNGNCSSEVRRYFEDAETKTIVKERKKKK